LTPREGGGNGAGEAINRAVRQLLTHLVGYCAYWGREERAFHPVSIIERGHELIVLQLNLEAVV
jgi:hypothetical protein